MNELFYLCEAIIQTLENDPFRVKEKDLSVHKLWNAKCSFFSVSEKKKAINCQGWVYLLHFQVLVLWKNAALSPWVWKPPIKGKSNPFTLCFHSSKLNYLKMSVSPKSDSIFLLLEKTSYARADQFTWLLKVRKCFSNLKFSI